VGRAEALRDQLISQDIRDLLAHDRRLWGLAVAAEVRDGIACVEGDVRCDEDRWLLRRLIGRVQGVRAVWDLLRLPGEGLPRVLDLGCGNKKQYAWSVGLDRCGHPAVDVIADLERALPLRSESFDQVFAIHVLELIPLMDEIHRVLKPNGVLHVLAPNWQFVHAVADPTHVRFFHTQTFKSFCRPGLGNCLFAPLAIAACQETVFADLRPVEGGQRPPTEEELARFFT
jgi:SAM-dependent methyltransferase